MKTKRLVAILLVVLLSVSALGAFAEGAFDPMAKYDPPIKLTMFRQYGYDGNTSADTFINNLWLKEYEEKLGIQIDYKLIGYGDDYLNKVNLMTASEDYADVMQVNLRQLYQLIDAECLMDLTDVWNQYASQQAVASMTADGTQNLDMASRDGKLYAIPAVIPNRETIHAVAIREDWRKKLNLPEPKTMDDLEAIMYAFVQQDPDGNGENDTIGLGVNKDLFTSGYEITSFFNAFGAYPKAWIENDQGEVVYGGILDTMKPALAKLQQYYQDGLIDKEFTVKDEVKESELVAKGKCGVYFGVQWAGFIGNAVATVWKEDVQAEWKVYPIPVANQSGMPIMWNTTDSFFAVSKDCANPEAIIKICNYIHFMGQGPQGEGPFAVTFEEWEALWAEWVTSPFAPETIHNNVERWLLIEEARTTGDTSAVDANYLCQQLYSDMTRYWEQGRNATNAKGEEDLDFAASQAVLDMCKSTFLCALDAIESGKVVKDIRGAYVAESMVDNQPTLDKIELEMITRIITGEASLEEFDNYIANWKALGGDQITEEMNAWYQSIK